MNGFKFSTPRLALGLTAVATAAITLGVLVVLPAQFDSVSPEADAISSARAATMTSSEVRVGPGRGPAREAEAIVAIRASHVELGCADVKPHALASRHRKSSAAG